MKDSPARGSLPVPIGPFIIPDPVKKLPPKQGPLTHSWASLTIATYKEAGNNENMIKVKPTVLDDPTKDDYELIVKYLQAFRDTSATKKKVGDSIQALSHI